MYAYGQGGLYKYIHISGKIDKYSICIHEIYCAIFSRTHVRIYNTYVYIHTSLMPQTKRR